MCKYLYFDHSGFCWVYFHFFDIHLVTYIPPAKTILPEEVRQWVLLSLFSLLWYTSRDMHPACQDYSTWRSQTVGFVEFIFTSLIYISWHTSRLPRLSYLPNSDNSSTRDNSGTFMKTVVPIFQRHSEKLIHLGYLRGCLGYRDHINGALSWLPAR